MAGSIDICVFLLPKHRFLSYEIGYTILLNVNGMDQKFFFALHTPI